jgi:hypothetical protein|tara:strand:- start:7 stop:480 length:474 start_codon:yes stop_codon:yes gene_type:complete
MKKLANNDVQDIWDKCLYVGWVDFLPIGRCHSIFKRVLAERHNITGESLVDIGNKYSLKRFFIKNKGDAELFTPFPRQAIRAVLCGRIKFFKSLMSTSSEELTLDGFLYYLSKNKWRRYINAYDAELAKERNKNKASAADRYISLRGLSSSGFESAK